MTLTVGSLFSGIGGLDLGLERAGMRVVWQAEIDPYCSRVLAKHWPDVPNLGDVTAIDWTEVPHVDVICGGYPCQPFSQAGRRLGDQDPRHLWPWMLDTIRVLRPRYALLENVAGHLALGFGRVLGDLAEIRYDTVWDCIPAAAVGAPHRRDRVFVVAYPAGRESEQNSTSLSGGCVGVVSRPSGEWWTWGSRGRSGSTEHVADPDDERPQGCWLPEGGWRHALPDSPRSSEGVAWPAPRQSGEWATEPDVGRVAHGIPHRVDRLRALGNAVVPQVAEYLGRLIVDAFDREAA